ncbi:DUF4351 domain-containing protein [Leptothermofonsia sichuanensis E412]|uniref:DUF4351 domain-containing protein n=1 Tax=Leptothermofonsia sichuanensis TaxID=2917832 RepID=UPI001CA68B51|nr:DUF4351 domain-containing protein [Leptothermofonsia sichuanensis]QZZ22523.1 DUF4351 domain-containing protein [Leptothermofonsia sichuanensis E412]
MRVGTGGAIADSLFRMQINPLSLTQLETLAGALLDFASQSDLKPIRKAENYQS